MSGKTLDFAARMAARHAVTKDGEPKAETSPNLIPVRRFNDAGKKRVLEILEQVRTQNDLFMDEVEELLTDPEYTEEIAESYRIDPTRIFHTKLDLCRYFTEEVFPDSFIESATTRADTGLWTWLAIAYYTQFVKKGKDVVRVNADCCWVYNSDDYRFGRRHYVAGAVYLYRDVKPFGGDALTLLFTPPPTEFGRLVDAMTNVRDSIRTPAFFGAAVKLYYDSSKKSKYSSAAINQNGPGSIRQLTRVLQQFRETYDFVGADSVMAFCDRLPAQFDAFRKG